VQEDLEAALDDHVEAIAWIALPQENVVGLEPDLLQLLLQPAQDRLVQPDEGRNGSQQGQRVRGLAERLW
jgi:hypothetical protein